MNLFLIIMEARILDFEEVIKNSSEKCLLEDDDVIVSDAVNTLKDVKRFIEETVNEIVDILGNCFAEGLENLDGKIEAGENRLKTLNRKAVENEEYLATRA